MKPITHSNRIITFLSGIKMNLAPVITALLYLSFFIGITSYFFNFLNSQASNFEHVSSMYTTTATLVTAIATILTGLIVFWYTWETNLLRKATYRQLANQIKPLPILIKKKGKSQFFIKNIGNGTAIDITLSPAQIETTRKIKFYGIQYLEAKSESEIEWERLTSQELLAPKDDPIAQNVVLSPEIEPFLIIDFKDVENIHYSCSQRFTKIWSLKELRNLNPRP